MGGFFSTQRPKPIREDEEIGPWWHRLSNPRRLSTVGKYTRTNARIFVRKHYNLTYKRWPLICILASGGKVNLLRLALLFYDIKLNATTKDRTSRTALDIAIENNHYKSAAILLQQKGTLISKRTIKILLSKLKPPYHSHTKPIQLLLNILKEGENNRKFTTYVITQIIDSDLSNKQALLQAIINDTDRSCKMYDLVLACIETSDLSISISLPSVVEESEEEDIKLGAARSGSLSEHSR